MDIKVVIPDEFVDDPKAARAYELGMKRGYSWGHKDGYEVGELRHAPWPLTNQRAKLK